MIARVRFFPTPLPDESFFSLLARYHYRSGNCSPSQSLKQLFGTPAVATTSSLPGMVGRLVERLPEVAAFGTQAFIDNHTLLNYYRLFRSSRVIAETVSQMSGGSGSGIAMRIGSVVAPVNWPRIPQFCIACVQDDIRQHGEAYWHRSHQLPGIQVCFRHNIPLLGSCRACRVESPRRSDLYLPSLRCENGHLLVIPDHVQWQDDAQWLSRISHEFLQKGNEVVDCNLLRRSYYKAALKKGLCRSSGKLNLGALVEAIQSKYSVEFLSAVNLESRNKSPNAHWSLPLFHRTRSGQHPLKHLLLIGAIFDSTDEFWASFHSEKDNESSPPAARRSSRPVRRKRRGRCVVNWKERDTLIAAEIKRIASELKEKHNPPIRLTRGAILSRLNLLTLSSPILRRLPNSARALQEVCETGDAFRLRSIRLALETMKREKRPMTIGGLRKLSRARHRSSECIEDTLRIVVRNHFQKRSIVVG